MKKNIRLFVFVGIFVPSSLCFAADIYIRSPYVGVEAIKTNQNYYNDYGKGILAKNIVDYNFFGGLNFSKHFGLEVGYTFQPEKNKKTILANGQKIVGGDIVVTSSDGAFANSYISGTHPYLGFFANTQIGKIKFKAMAGVSFSEINVQCAYKEAKEVSTFAYSDFKIVPLLKIISEYSFDKHFGVRLSLNYNQFSRFSMLPKFNDEGGIKLKDRLGIGLGFTYSLFF